MGTYASGNAEDQQKFRAISLDRNQSSCILQIRNDVPAEYAAIQWINFGFYCYSPYVPFFTNVNDTPAKYRYATNDVQPDKSAYWQNKLLEVIVEPHYHDFINEVNDFRDRCQSYGVSRVDSITKAAQVQNSANLVDYLTEQNMKTANHVLDEAHRLISSLTRQALLNSRFQFERGDNL